MKRVHAVIAILFATQAGVLLYLGQPLICTCGYVTAFVSDIWSSQMSQQLFDWYTFSHIIHGFIFYVLLWKFFPRMPFLWRLAIAVGAEALWEITENTPWLINEYRKQALAQGYVGDSIINSLLDTVSMFFGFILAKKLPWKTILILAIIMEIGVALFIRDNLTLNILNFILPLDFIHAWQAAR